MGLKITGSYPAERFSVTQAKLVSGDGSFHTLPSIDVQLGESYRLRGKSLIVFSERLYVLDRLAGQVFLGGYRYARNAKPTAADLKCLSSDGLVELDAAVMGGVVTSFGHYFVDYLDQFALFPEYGQSLKCGAHILESGLRLSVVGEVNDYLGFNTLNSVSVRSGAAAYSIGNLEFTASVQNKPYFRPSIIREFNSRSRRYGAAAPAGTLILSRSTHHRRLKNEVDLIKAVSSPKSIAQPEMLSFADQVRFVQSASNIITGLGSQAFNLIWANRGTRVLLLVQEPYLLNSGDNYIMIRSLCTALELELIVFSCVADELGYQSDYMLTDVQLEAIARLTG
jgi:hypothetical protein